MLAIESVLSAVRFHPPCRPVPVFIFLLNRFVICACSFPNADSTVSLAVIAVAVARDSPVSIVESTVAQKFET